MSWKFRITSLDGTLVQDLIFSMVRTVLPRALAMGFRERSVLHQHLRGRVPPSAEVVPPAVEAVVEAAVDGKINFRSPILDFGLKPEGRLSPINHFHCQVAKFPDDALKHILFLTGLDRDGLKPILLRSIQGYISYEHG